MKTVTLLVLFFSFFACSSFEKIDNHSAAGVFAFLDGEALVWDNDHPSGGLLIYQTALINGRAPASTVIDINLNGPSYLRADGKRFSESLELVINCEHEKVDKSPMFTVQLLYKGANYFSVKELSEITITNFSRFKDGKHFNLSADFDIVMRSYGYPLDDRKDINLRGSIINMVIAVPGWEATQKAQAAF
jgi:hypothetical protein